MSPFPVVADVFPAEEALDWGFVDEIISGTSKMTKDEIDMTLQNCAALSLPAPELSQQTDDATFINKVAGVLKGLISNSNTAAEDSSTEDPAKAAEPKKQKTTMKEDFKTVNALLSVNGLEQSEDGKIMLTADQVTAIENALANAKASEQTLTDVVDVLDKVSDNVKAITGVKNKVLAIVNLLDRLPAGAPAGNLVPEQSDDKMKKIAEEGGKVLFVGTKKQAQQIILDEATRSGSFYINQRWLGGTLTNFRTIQKRIKRLIEIEQMEADGTISVYPKKEQVLIHKEAVKLENFLGGIKEMKKLPDAVVVVDPCEDHNAVAEARKLNIPVFGLTDTNCDPAKVDIGVAANDDAIKSIKLMMSLLADAIVETKGGILQDAYQEGEIENDITMEDVIINVEQHAAEQEKRRKAAAEARNNRFNNDRRPRRFNSEKRYINKKEETATTEAKQEAKAEDVEKKAEATEAPVEVKEEVKEAE